MSEGAKYGWKQFADECEMKMLPGGEFEDMTGFAGKLAEHAARIAANLQVFYDFNAPELDEEFMINGIVIARYFAKQMVAKRAYAAKDSVKIDAENLIDWVYKWRRDGRKEKYVCSAVISTHGPNALRRKERWVTGYQVPGRESLAGTVEGACHLCWRDPRQGLEDPLAGIAGKAEKRQKQGYSDFQK